MTPDLVAIYARVSTDNQDVQPQVEKLEEWAEFNEYEFETFIDDGISATADVRPGFDQMMNKIDKFDAVAISKLDRLGRSTNKLSTWAHELNEMGIDLIVTEQSIDTSTMEGKFLFDILSAVAELERKLARERMKEGFERAKEEGRIGRPKKDLDVDRIVELYNLGATISALADNAGVSRTTIYDRLRERGVMDEPETNEEDDSIMENMEGYQEEVKE